MSTSTIFNIKELEKSHATMTAEEKSIVAEMINAELERVIAQKNVLQEKKNILNRLHDIYLYD